MGKLTPLPHEWMLVSIIGFLISVWMVWDIDKTWGFTLAIFFGMTFIACMVSMTQATLEDDHLAELAIHDSRVRRGAHRSRR